MLILLANLDPLMDFPRKSRRKILAMIPDGEESISFDNRGG